MVSIVSKKINGKEYLYLVGSVRNGLRVIQKTIKYIGPKRPIRKEEFECMQLSASKKDWILVDFNEELSYHDHNQMKKASKEYDEYVKKLDSISKEKEREKFLSEFIANSNAIEGSTLTIKDTYNYLFNDIAPKGATRKEIFMATNLLEAWDYVEKNYHRPPIEKDILKLHSLVNKGIEEESTLGKYKKIQNYIGDTLTTSLLYVEERMKMLMSWLKKAQKRIDIFEIAFQSHAQFETIHPFIDGNGRVGRILLNWILMNNKLSPLAIKSKNRADYIVALENSRKGKREAICKFCMQQYLTQYSFEEPEAFGVLKSKNLPRFVRDDKELNWNGKQN